MKKYYLVFFVFVVYSLLSCSSSTYMFMGDKLYKEGKYHESCTKYIEAYKKCDRVEVKRKGDIAEKIARIYESIKDYRKAFIWYKKSLLSKDKMDVRVKELLDIAFLMGRDSEVEKLKRKYDVECNNFHIPIADRRYELFPFEPANSRNDDFAPSFRGDDTSVLYFASNRKRKNKIKQRKSPIDNKYNSNIYMTEFTDEIVNSKSGAVKYLGQMEWIKSKCLKDSLLNTNEDDGVMCFNQLGDKLYFTSSRRERGVYMPAKIFSADVDKKGLFSNIKKVEIVPDTVAVGHPAISSDGSKLFFASRMNGGYGKSDIWYCIKSEGKWSKPINAGNEINSAGNEMYPSFNSEGDLFIASDGHDGYGGLDIFKVCGIYGKYELKNLGVPFNTKADDFHIIFYPGLDKGFFTSSRKKKFVDDIYFFAINPFKFNIEISLIDKRSSRPIENANVRMIDTNGQTYRFMTDKNGMAKLEWINRGEANFVVQANGYLRESFIVDTRNVEEDSSYEKRLAFNRMNSTIEVPNIFYRFGKADLTDSSKESLNDLVVILNDNPSITIVLGAHTDMIGDVNDNMRLSKERARSVVEFLILKGIKSDRLTTEGYGESLPKTISYEEADMYSFLKAGQKLSPAFIRTLPKRQANMANKLNRRTEFRVLRTDYSEKK